MSLLARLLVRVFFRDLEVADGASLPPSGPTLLVANHQNGLVDGLVLMAALPRHPRFLGKATLWRILPLRPFLALAGVIPVYRSVEANQSSEAVPADRAQRNDQAFTTSRRLLGEGAMVTVFPEGISHDESRVQELRTGAARIALGAAADDAIANVCVTAAGLVYDDKSRFRSRALVRVGPSRPVAPYVPRYRSDARGAVHALTADIGDDLRTVAPDYQTWAFAERCARLAGVAMSSPAAAPSHLADLDRLTRRVADLAATADGGPVFDQLSEDVTSYRRAVALLGLSDEQVIAEYSLWRYRRRLVWSVLKVMVAAPVAGVGVTVHAVPYSLIKVLARLPDNEGMKATVKVGGCFGLFTLTYLGLAVGVARRRGGPGRPRCLRHGAGVGLCGRPGVGAPGPGGRHGPHRRHRAPPGHRAQRPPLPQSGAGRPRRSVAGRRGARARRGLAFPHAPPLRQRDNALLPDIG